MRHPARHLSAKRKRLCAFRLLLCRGFAVLFLATSLRAIDVVQPSAPAEPAASAEDLAKPLGELVGKLAALEALAPRDLADFATETIAYSQAVQAAKQRVSEKPIHDALAAVAQGRTLDAKAADWDGLRSRLEKFLEKPEQQKQDQQQQQQDKNQKDDRKQDQQKDRQKNQQDQQDQSGDKQDQQQQNQSGENKDQQQQQQGQDQKNQQGGEQQSQQQDGQQDGKTDDMREQSAKPQKESAFGDMKKKEDEKKDDASQQNAGEQQSQEQPQPRPADMQQIGGADGKQQQQPVDSSMIMPLRQLDQVRDKDAPAVLFQRMQAAQSGTTQIPADAQKPKGKDW